MSESAVEPAVERAAEWMYRGIWKVLSGWFRVPEHAPTLPAPDSTLLLSFHPSRRYLSYLKLYFWIVLVVIDVAILAVWIAVFIYVNRGPVQQLFGISDIVVETAGAAEGEGQNKFAVGNKAIMEGIDNPEEIRELIMERVRASKGAGLGERLEAEAGGWTPEQVGVLREILAVVAKPADRNG